MNPDLSVKVLTALDLGSNVGKYNTYLPKLPIFLTFTYLPACFMIHGFPLLATQTAHLIHPIFFYL